MPIELLRHDYCGQGGTEMWMIVAILLLLWFYGLISDLFGNMIHLLLIVALMALVFHAASNK
jgi:Family of unknown function (DUF5670)